MAVTATWERPDGRRQLSVTAPLFIECNGVRVRARDWSLSGFSVAECTEPWPAGTETKVKVALPFQGFDVSFEAPVRVVESSAHDGVFVAEYVNLGSRERELLRHFLDELVRGSMSDVGDTIGRIDVPVVPVSITPPGASQLEAGAAPRRAHPGLMTALYTALGALVFGYLGHLAYTNAFRFEVDRAVLASPGETLVAQGDGFVTPATLRPGDPVKAGEVIANLFDNQLEREIELSEITVRERESRFTLLQKRALDALNRLQSTVDSTSSGSAKIKLEIESLRARVQATEQEVRRVSAKPRDPQTVARIEEAKKKLLANQKALEGKQIDMRTRLERDLNSPSARALTPGQNALQEMTALEAQMVQAEQDYEFAQLRHQSIVAHRARLAIVAPFDGTLVSLPASARTAVRKGDAVAVVEQRVPPRVTAVMTPAEALRVGLGDTARLYVPALGTYLPARVTRIEHMTDSHSDGGLGAAGSIATGSKEQSARVTLDLEQPELVKDRPLQAAALPVVVQFQRRWSTTVASAAARTAASGLATVKNTIGAPPTRAATSP
jgi:multidrug resistance efflux pump